MRTTPRLLVTAATAVLVGAGLLLAAAPAQAAIAPVTLRLEIQGPDGVFVPVASGAQFAVSSTTPTVARWTLTNTRAAEYTGFYLYSYGPDCALSDITIAASSTFVCTETIAPEDDKALPVYGFKNLGALAGFYDGVDPDFSVAYPLIVNIIDDSNGQTFALSRTTVDPGDTIVATGGGFDADDALTGILVGAPAGSGSFTVTGTSFSHTITVPTDLAPGTHTVVLYSNGVAYAVRSFEVRGAALAATGIDAGMPLALALAALAAGGWLVGGSRRRPRGLTALGN
jgi:hypothetical protein